METKDHIIPHQGLTLATKVTIARLMGVPVFIGLLVYYLDGLAHGQDHWKLRLSALIVFIVVAATDALDGYLARSRNEITKLGKVLDPLADKMLLMSAIILLTRDSLPQFEPNMPLWFTLMLITRDVAIVIGYFLVHHFIGHVEVHPRWSGKVATVAAMLAVVWVLLQWSSPWFFWLVVVAASLTALSGFQYLFDCIRQLGKAGRH